MSVRIVNELKAYARGQLLLLCYSPDRWRAVPVLLFPLPLLFVLGIIVRPDLTVSSNFLFALGMTGGWAGLWVFLVLGSWYSWGSFKRTEIITISCDGIRSGDTPTQDVSEWSEWKGVICTKTDILFLYPGFGSGRPIPLNAFADPREAQRFYEMATIYWRSAKGLPPFAPDTDGVWPPAPGVGNSAEPEDRPKC